MDIQVVSTGEKIFKCDDGAARALLAAFPEAFCRINPKVFNVTPAAPTTNAPGSLQYTIQKDELHGGARLKIACLSCGFNTHVFPTGGWKAALTVAKDVGTIAHCQGRAKETIPPDVAQQYAEANGCGAE
jgi:hypothetical protein